jgi:Ca2+:H+ antiporter
MPKPRLAWLLVFVPVSVFARWGAHNDVVTFAASALAILPLAGLIGTSTEQLAIHVGSRLGGILNATLGNVAEILIGIFLVLDDEFEIVKASLTGSIIANLLLVLGLSFLVGGRKREEQSFSARAANTHSVSLLLAVVALTMPALFVHAAPHESGVEREVVSAVVGGVLIAMYFGALLFTLVTHQQLFPATANHEAPEWTRAKSIAVLVASAALVGLESELLVGGLEPTVERWGLSKLFVGLILVPIIGNAAEHSSALKFARDDDMDVALEIAVGSSTQIALLVAPLLVFVSLIAGHPMDFVFTTFEIAAVALSTIVVMFISQDGRSNWLEGLQLVGAYAIMAISFFFLKL